MGLITAKLFRSPILPIYSCFTQLEYIETVTTWKKMKQIHVIFKFRVENTTTKSGTILLDAI